MNPRQRRLRRQRRKARVRDSEAARLELVELRRKAVSVMEQAQRSLHRQTERAVKNLTPKERALLAARGVVLPDPLPEPKTVLTPDPPRGGALLAAMTRTIKG